jgi:hypothetical protein
MVSSITLPLFYRFSFTVSEVTFMPYLENPKTKGSGIICAIPQQGTCPLKCDDCFFQSGRSYLEPLDQNLPNVPPVELAHTHVVRVNDGHDSSTLSAHQIEEIRLSYPRHFFNTSAIPAKLEQLNFFEGSPFVWTINPGKLTDTDFYKLDKIPKNLMFVRVRTNTWNLDLVNNAIEYYCLKEVPIILTFMAYYQTKDGNAQVNLAGNEDYIFRKRTLNEYWAITTKAWHKIMNRYRYNKWVYSCGKIEGEQGDTHCRFCGNCLREFFVTQERLTSLR